MGAINVWLAHLGVAYDKFGMGGCRNVCFLGDPATISYSHHIRISKIEKQRVIN